MSTLSNINLKNINLNGYVSPKININDIKLGNSLPNFKIDNNATLMKSTDYTKLSLHEQILLRPPMYIGSISKTLRTDRILNIKDDGGMSFVNQDMDYPLGCERLFLEILYNATDNVINSREKKHDIGEIKISMDNQWVIVRNGGVPMPIEIHPIHNIWTPSLVFGEFLVSNTYEKKTRTGIGMNGYGAKLTNTFSTEFIVKIGNPYNGLEFSQRFYNNKLNYDQPIITQGYKGEPYVEVAYKMDFAKFGYTEYPPYVSNLYAAYAAEAAFASKVPISFNGTKFAFKDIRDFANLIINNPAAKYIIHYEYPPGTELKQVKQPNGTFSMMSVDVNIVPITEVCVLDTPHEAKVSSFVNSSNTKMGGVHVEAVYDEVGKTVLEAINNQFFGSKENKKGTSRKFTLTKGDLKNHMSVVVSCWIPDPDCGSQEKVKLAGPKPHIKFNEKIIKYIMDWELVNQLYVDLEAKMGKLNDNKSKKSRRLITGTIQDAYYAGTEKSSQCVLYRTEGKSAMGYAYTMRSEMSEEQMQYVGISCERGKPMNIMNASLFRIVKSKKYQELYEHLGLTEGMDYRIDENFRTLRYGTLAIMTDADVDGKHITSLLLNIFYCRFPTLLQRPFVVLIRTPILRISKGKITLKFYSAPEYEKWKLSNHDHHTWTHKYYKGLATSSNEVVAEDTKNPRIAFFVYDDTTPQLMKLAFDKEFANKRKDWIANYKLYDGIEEIRDLPISSFINFEAVQYAVTNLGRSIPRFDGLKEVQRKSIYASKLHWKGKPATKSMIVDRLSNMVAEKTDYHYGVTSIIGTITRMALSFPGTNNMPHFYPDGQFGTRNDDGDDAGAARYISTYPEFFWNYVYRPEDDNILQYNIDNDGERIEPVVFYPIIPMAMANGCLGIGTGSSTFIPNFNIIDVIESIKCLINDTKLPKLIPYYNGFTGTVSLEQRGKLKVIIPVIQSSTGSSSTPVKINFSELLKDKIVDGVDGSEDIESQNTDTINDNITLGDIETNDDGDFVDASGKVISDTSNGANLLKIVTTGVFKIIDGKKLEISELPIGRSIKQYDAFLAKLKEDKEIKDYKNLSKHDRPKFEIYGYGKYINADLLKLSKSFSMSNMVLLTDENRPVKFKDQYDLIRQWYDRRLPIYDRRKNYLIKNKYEEIIKNQLKLKFTIALVEGAEKGYIPGQTILIMKQKKAETLRQMAEMNIPADYLKGAKMTNLLDDDGISKLKVKIEKLVESYNNLNSVSAQQMWLNDLEEFKKVYLSNYPQDKNRTFIYD